MSSTDVFSYCQVCRINHTQKRKHIFTKKHKQKLQAILKRFAARLKLAEPYLKNPLIQEGEYEPGASFWCHFCGSNVNKHVTDGMKSIIYGGVIEHIASKEHCLATEKFWHMNGAELKFKSTFIVSEKDLNAYKEKLSDMVDKFEGKTTERTKKAAVEIKAHENMRDINTIRSLNSPGTSTSQLRTIYRTLKNEHGILQNPAGVHDDVRVWKSGIIKYKPSSEQLISSKYCKKNGKNQGFSASNRFIFTVTAESKGLTQVRSTFDNSYGNVHTGATPPWMLENNDDNKDAGNDKISIVGPSEEEFRNFLKKSEKKKLNPKRVGANFDHTPLSEDRNWLPSFGRVWNDGARWKSRQQYRDECLPAIKKSKNSN